MLIASKLAHTGAVVFISYVCTAKPNVGASLLAMRPSQPKNISSDFINMPILRLQPLRQLPGPAQADRASFDVDQQTRAIEERQ